MPESQQDEEILAIAQEIRNYLTGHPNAADGLEGIAKWWLSRQRYQENLAKVEKALDYLVTEGLIEKIRKPRTPIIYAKPESRKRTNH